MYDLRIVILNLLHKIKLYSTSFVLFFLVVSSSFAITPEEQLNSLIIQQQNEQALSALIDQWQKEQALNEQALDKLIDQWEKEQALNKLIDEWLKDQNKQALDDLVDQWKKEQALSDLIDQWQKEQTSNEQALDKLVDEWKNEQALNTLIHRWEIDYPIAPIPEPETYAMMLAGLGLIGVIARRRKQQQALV
jgi:hypothetical protein